MKVLLADDSSVARGKLGSSLRAWGYEVTEATNGDDAWRILQSDDSPRLALIDFMMPGMNGSDVCERVRKLKGQDYIYIILITALPDRRTKFECLEAGADAFISKSCDEGELEHRIHAGQRVVELQDELLAQNSKLSELSAIVEYTDDAIFRKDLDGTIRTWNKGAIKLYGYTPEQVIGRHVSMLGPAILHAEMEMLLARVGSGKSVDNYETKRLRSDGTEIDVSLTASPICNDQGRTIAVSVIARNITGRKEAEKKVLEATRSREQFLATLSHELRNPMAAVLTAANLLNEEVNEFEAREACDIIGRHVRHLARMLDDLFDMSKMTHDKISLHKEVLDINQLVIDIVECVQPLIDEKQQRLYVHKSAESLHVLGDVGRLQQAQVNLLVNASRYSPPDTRIDYRIDRDGDDAVISVRDQGEGICSSLIGQIFEPFVQADQALDRSRGGMGLGLPLVQLIVEAHGGTVKANSPGRSFGSEFTVRLPLTEPPAKRLIDVAAREMTGKKLLIVEDHPAIAKMLKRTMEIKGFEVVAAENGMEALRIIHEFRPNVAVIDIGLPDMDGYEIARRIRRDPQFDGVMLVALTGYGRDSDHQNSQNAGFDLHLVKPLDPNELLRAINAHLPLST